MALHGFDRRAFMRLVGITGGTGLVRGRDRAADGFTGLTARNYETKRLLALQKKRVGSSSSVVLIRWRCSRSLRPRNVGVITSY